MIIIKYVINITCLAFELWNAYYFHVK